MPDIDPDKCSLLRVRRSKTQECANIVSVCRQDGQFVAVCRDTRNREESAINTDQSLAVIHAAMKLFEPDTEPAPKVVAGYVIETENMSVYHFDPDELEPKPQRHVDAAPGGADGIWQLSPSRFDVANEVLNGGLMPLFVPRKRRDSKD